jgi:hypothetical protein
MIIRVATLYNQRLSWLIGNLLSSAHVTHTHTHTRHDNGPFIISDVDDFGTPYDRHEYITLSLLLLFPSSIGRDPRSAAYDESEKLSAIAAISKNPESRSCREQHIARRDRFFFHGRRYTPTRESKNFTPPPHRQIMTISVHNNYYYY